MPAYVSRLLTRYQPAESDAPFKLVIGLRTPPDRTMRRVARGGAQRLAAINALRAAGLRDVPRAIAGLQPLGLFQGQRSVPVEVSVHELQRLAASEAIEFIRPMRMHRMHLDASAPLIGANAATQSGFDGKGIRVAVIDSGIDHHHPDLKGRVVLQHSRNFTTEGTASDVMDGNGHGTHVAGIIGGAGKPYRGVAPAVEFIACKVFDSTGRATAETAIQEAVRWAVAHGADVINYSGGFAPVTNGVPLFPPPWVWPAQLLEEEQEFKNAMEAGVVCVVSAGNEGDLGQRGTLSMPATCSDVLSVGATDKSLAVSGFSSAGPAYRTPALNVADMVDSLSQFPGQAKAIPKVDVVAPGGEVDPGASIAGGCFYKPGIISAKASRLAGAAPCNVGDRHRKLSGTSQAAPHISGFAALLLQALRAQNAKLGTRPAYRVKTMITNAANRLQGYPPRRQGRGLPTWQAIGAALGI